MKLNELFPSKGQNKNRKRVGRGPGSGLGTTSGRGHKGYNSRSGGGVRVGFEGGQMPIYRRLPKRGFNNIFKVKYQIVNIFSLSKFDNGDVIDKYILYKVGIIKSLRNPVKLLGNGKVFKALTVRLNKVSKNAKLKINDVGGKIEEVI